jgi:hypothetical protein
MKQVPSANFAVFFVFASIAAWLQSFINDINVKTFYCIVELIRDWDVVIKEGLVTTTKIFVVPTKLFGRFCDVMTANCAIFVRGLLKTVIGR